MRVWFKLDNSFVNRFEATEKIMRVVGEIPHPELKITIFHWNNRYLIKLEAGFFEQTFKVPEYDIASEDEVKKIVDEAFIKAAIIRFDEMAKSLQSSMKNT